MSERQKPRERKEKGYRHLWRAVQFLGPHRRMAIISTSCALVSNMLLASGLSVIIPIINVMVHHQTVAQWGQTMVDQHVAPVPLRLRAVAWVTHFVPDNSVAAVATVFAVLIVLNLIGNTFRFFEEYLSDKCVISAVNDVRRVLYDHVLHVPLTFFGTKGTSDVTSQIMGDCTLLQDGLKILFGQCIFESISATIMFSVALITDIRLTGFIVLFGPLAAFVFQKFGKKMRRASRATLQTNSQLLGQIESSLSGIRVVKANSAERFERRRYAKILGGLRRELLKMARYEALNTPVTEVMGICIGGSVLIFATYLMFSDHVSNQLTIGKFGIIMTCLLSLSESLRKLSKMNRVLQSADSAATRIFETIEIPIERRRQLLKTSRSFADGQDRLSIGPIQREVAFEHISFSYPNAASPALSDVNLVVPKGKSLAIVGRNGSGKTTLMALLPRFYDPDQGRIMIDGIDIRRCTLRSLRKQISVVTQESVIFPGTIAENIAYGLPLASQAEIESAAQQAFAHDFIMEKSNGYQTPLDGLGGQLSGGQRQRLNIARAILRKAPILILDEATSQVDAESEHLIQTAIESLMHQRTTFVIAHRFSTILSADSIVVMDRGKIIGQGKHDDLLLDCPTYQQLYERQIIGMPSRVAS
jgi:subfamily B ATP-binding cassette protein MsbA